MKLAPNEQLAFFFFFAQSNRAGSRYQISEIIQQTFDAADVLLFIQMSFSALMEQKRRIKSKKTFTEAVFNGSNNKKRQL